MTPLEFAKRVGVSRIRVYAWMKEGRIKSNIVDGHWEIPEGQEKPVAREPGRKATIKEGGK